MPILRKLIPCGNSQSVTLPKTWLTLAEEKEGKKIVAVEMEVDGCLTLTPVFEKNQKAMSVEVRGPTPTARDNTPEEDPT